VLQHRGAVEVGDDAACLGEARGGENWSSVARASSGMGRLRAGVVSMLPTMHEGGPGLTARGENLDMTVM
jgi:hypothetical protein